MLNQKIISRLESLRELPSIPNVLSEVLQAVDNLDLSAKSLAHIIEKDQALTARVLRVANSPFYGFSRKIATIDLAIVILGLNTIKEIVLSLVLKRFFASISKHLFDVHGFWNYSIYCGTAAKYLARKLDYRLSGEAFVAGLMHDIGILILIQYFASEFKLIREVQKKKSIALLDAEKEVLNSHHGEIGAWLAERWQLPQQLCEAIREHHNKYDDNPLEIESEYEGIQKPLTAIVATAEWFAGNVGLKLWTLEKKTSHLFFEESMIDLIAKDAILNHESIVERMRVDINADFEKALETHTII